MTLTKGSKISERFAELEFNLQRGEYNVVRILSTIPPYTGDEVTALQVNCTDVQEWKELNAFLENIKMDYWFQASYPHEGRSMITEQPLSREDSDKD